METISERKAQRKGNHQEHWLVWMRKIVGMKIDGYGNKEIYLTLDIKPSTYYEEMKQTETR